MRPILAMLLATAVPAFPAVAQTPPPAPQPAADRPGRTPAGTVFTQPGAWSLATQPALVTLTAPEGDLAIALVDVGPATDARAAAAAAWKAWKPAMTRPPKTVTARPPRDGWDERQVVDYETSPNEKRILGASALRAGKAWTVLLVDGNEGTAEKRLAATALIQQSVRPAGYVKESFAGRTAHPMDAARIAQLKTFVATAIRELGVPGAAFALTTREKTIYSTGVGVRLLGDPTPVDGDSEFAIASNTKGLATLLLAKLVDEGKLQWDQPVTQVYPAFRLGSDATTKKVLVKHLVCACTGLPRKDMQVLLNSNPDAAASDTFVQLAATEPTSGFGEVFQYNNLMAAAAGYIGGYLVYPDRELGSAFYTAMDNKVFRPLGMTATTFDYDRILAPGSDWARPHGEGIDLKPHPLTGAGMKLNYAFSRYAGAGGAWSTANDLIKYVRFELNEGKLDSGLPYVSAKNLLQRRVPNVPIGESATYGMGLEVDTTWGVPVVHHGGSLAGYKTDIIVIPGANIGAVILTNAEEGQMLLRPFQRRLLELLYDGRPEAAGDVAAAAKRNATQMAEEASHIAQVPDAAAVAALAPSYSNPDLGTLKVTTSGTGVTFAFRTLSTPMGTRKNDDGTISFVALDPTLLFFPLVVGERDGKKVLIARDSQHEFAFVADAAAAK